MSLILEALKKSERERQVGTAPTLATPPMSRKRKRSLLPWLVAAIAIAGAAGWWLSRETAPEPTPVAERTPAPASATTSPATSRPSRPEAPMTTVAPPPEKPLPPATDPAKYSEQQIAKVAAAVAKAAPASTAQIAANTPAPPPAPVAAPVADNAPANPIAPPAPSPASPSVAPAPAAVAAAPRSAAASLPLLWELPYDKRKDIPQLTMSLQVYAADPSQRFAIVNDERHVEGDKLGDDLTLKEIAPEGLVVEYRGERFLFPRGGR